MDCLESMHACNVKLTTGVHLPLSICFYFTLIMCYLVWFFTSAQAKSALIQYKLFCIYGFEMISINSVNFVHILNGTSSMEIYQLT